MLSIWIWCFVVDGAQVVGSLPLFQLFISLSVWSKDLLCHAANWGQCVVYPHIHDQSQVSDVLRYAFRKEKMLCARSKHKVEHTRTYLEHSATTQKSIGLLETTSLNPAVDDAPKDVGFDGRARMKTRRQTFGAWFLLTSVASATSKERAIKTVHHFVSCV